MISPATLTMAMVEQPPSSLEDGLDELKAIVEHTRATPKLDQLPMFVKRTVFLKSVIEAGILAIEKDVQGLTEEKKEPEKNNSEQKSEAA